MSNLLLLKNMNGRTRREGGRVPTELSCTLILMSIDVRGDSDAEFIRQHDVRVVNGNRIFSDEMES